MEYVPEQLRGDRDAVLAAVEEDGMVLKLAATELKNDKVVVMAAVKQNCQAAQFAAEKLQEDGEILLEIVAWLPC